MQDNRSIDYYLRIVILIITILGPWAMMGGAWLATNRVL